MYKDLKCYPGLFRLFIHLIVVSSLLGINRCVDRRKQTERTLVETFYAVHVMMCIRN